MYEKLQFHRKGRSNECDSYEVESYAKQGKQLNVFDHTSRNSSKRLLYVPKPWCEYISNLKSLAAQYVYKPSPDAYGDSEHAIVLATAPVWAAFKVSARVTVSH